MSERMISRRVALRILGLAPAAAGIGYATGARASSHSEEPAGVEMLHDPGLDVVLAIAKVYSTKELGKEWWDAAAGNDTQGGTNGQKYARIATDLWKAFNVGIFYESQAKSPETGLLAQLFATEKDGVEVTYSGKAIVHNLGHFDAHAPNSGQAGKTYAHLMVCAFRCGNEAAKAATGDTVGVEDYNVAWKKVEESTFEALRKLDPELQKVPVGDVTLLNGGC